MACVFLLIPFLLVIIGKKCDRYVTGTVWIHKGGNADEGAATFEGCKKGCFNNGTYDSSGVRTCEKCSVITEENLCSDNGATCRWKQGKKKGKCISQSCPNLAKNLNAIDIQNPTAAVGKARKYDECVNGSPKEQYFNKVYIDDYIANSNTQDGVNVNLNLTNKQLCDDRIPATPGGQPPTQCRTLSETVRRRCEFDATVKFNNFVQQQTQKDLCMVQQQQIYDNLVNKSEYELRTGFSLPDPYCQHQVDRNVEQCNITYQANITACFNNYGLATETRDHVQTKAARAACHKVYHCMYSQSNERCSVWSIWAFVFFLVIMLLVGAAIVAAGAGLVPKLKSKVKDYVQL